MHHTQTDPEVSRRLARGGRASQQRQQHLHQHDEAAQTYHTGGAAEWHAHAAKGVGSSASRRKHDANECIGVLGLDQRGS